MMFKPKHLLILALCYLLVIPAIHAQEAISEQQFWNRLYQTQLLLESASLASGNERNAYIDEAQSQWTNVRSLDLGDGQTITIDPSWLMLSSDASPEQVDSVLRRVNALMMFYFQGGEGQSSGLSYERLRQLLEQERFQYGLEEPEPESPPPVQERPEISPSDQQQTSRGISSSVARLGLIALAVLIAGLVIAALFRELNTQPAFIRDEFVNVPETSADAHQRASESEEVNDYREAIRYLYLATLLLLDERRLIDFDPTLTNREHLRQVRSQPQMAELLERIVNVFDRVWYGFAPVDEALYTRFRDDVEQVRTL